MHGTNMKTGKNVFRQIPTSLVETGYRYEKRGKYIILWSLKSTVTPQPTTGAEQHNCHRN